MKRIHYISCILVLSLILGIHDGYIALWRSGGTEPEKIFSVPATNLPKADQQALEKGIVIHDEAGLSQILEDYLS